MTRVTLDLETRSLADLRKVGAWAYSEHPSTEVICASWTTDGEHIDSWINPVVASGTSLHPDYLDALLTLLADPKVQVEAHNVAFEYSLLENVCHQCMAWPRVTIDRLRDTMAVAAYYALPGALDKLCNVLGLPGKDAQGARLITKYSKLYLKTASHEISWDDALKFSAYCEQDVRQEYAVGELLGDLPEDEEEIFLHDFAVATRGMALDEAGILAAQSLVTKLGEDISLEFRDLTSLNVTQRDKVLKWLRDCEVDIDNLQRDTLEDLVEEDDLPRDARRAVELRLEHARTSTTKLDAMLRQVGTDGRARYQTRYHGTVTGRNTGSGFQPLNLVRSWEHVDPDDLVREVGRGDPRWLATLYGDPMEAVSKALRHYIRAAPGHRIIAGDFSSVEAVILACLAGEEWKIQAFRDKEPIYELGACSIQNWPQELAYDPEFKSKYPDERFAGKVRELACGYQGSVGAWRKFDKSDRYSDDEIKSMVASWRSDHPQVVDLWSAMEEAALQVVMEPVMGPATLTWRYGARTVERTSRLNEVGKVGFEMVEQWLTMVLPDGKRLWYFRPEVKFRMPPWHDPDNDEDCASGECDHRPRPQVCYLAYKNKGLRRVWAYGGHWTDNLCQATSRQILKPCELALEAEGYPVVLSVYDEIACEVPDGHGSMQEFLDIVNETVARLEWAGSWPIRMSCWQGSRYRK